MFLNRARGDQRLHRIELRGDLLAELAQRREARGVVHGAQLRFDLGPLLGEVVGVPVQTQRLGRLGFHRREVIAESGELLVEVGELAAELITGVVVVPVQPTQLRFDVLVKLVVVTQAEQVVADQPEDVRLDQIGGDGVPLRAFALVALLVPRAGVVAGLDPRAAGGRVSLQLAAADAAEDSAREQVGGLHCIPPVVRGVLVAGSDADTSDRFERLGVDDGRPGIFADDPVFLAAVLDRLVVTLNARPARILVPFAQRAAVVDAPAQVRGVLQHREDGLHREPSTS